MTSYLMTIPVCFLATGMFFSCHNTIEEINRSELEQNLPMQTIKNGTFTYSEKGKRLNELKAGTFLQYKNEDIKITDGLHLEIYNSDEETEATLSSVNGTFNNEQNILTARDSVVLFNTSGDSLLTEELIFYQDSDLIISHFPVEIRQQNNVIFGEGLKSNTSFTEYEIKNPAGSRIVIPEDSLKNETP